MSPVDQPLREHVGRRIREARESAGLSQRKLSELIGTGENGRMYLIRLEQGKHLPRPEKLEAIAEATGRDVEWFLPRLAPARLTKREVQRLKDAA